MLVRCRGCAQPARQIDLQSSFSVRSNAQVMAQGENNRSVAATAMNSRSSRSHLLVVIFVSSENRITKVHELVPAGANLPMTCFEW